MRPRPGFSYVTDRESSFLFKMPIVPCRTLLSSFISKPINHNHYSCFCLGVKQDEGQFFTPIPIARFMNYCIPYNHIIDDNIKNDNQDFIPKVIDYSCVA